MNEESISDANHDEAAKAFRQAGNNVQLLVRYNPAEFNRFQVNTRSLTPNVNQVYLFSFPVSVFVCMYIRILYISPHSSFYLTVLHPLILSQERLKQLNEVEEQGSPSKPSLQPEPEPVRQLYVR